MRRIFVCIALLFSLAFVSLAYATGPDNPLNENAYTWTGNGGVVLEGAGTGMQLGTTATTTVSITTIPAGSSIVKAYLYHSGGVFPTSPPSYAAGATINGVNLGTPNPYSVDTHYTEPEYDEKVYRWDATSVVTGNGDYTITTTYTAEGAHFFHELLIIFSNPSESSKQIIVNDGNEYLDSSSATTTFHSVEASGTATVYFSLLTNQRTSTDSASFNGVTLASGDLWNNDHGLNLDIDVFPVTTVSGDNTAGVSTSEIVSWHLAVLEVVTEPSTPPQGISEFSLALPLVTSLAAVILLAIRKRIEKKPE